MKFFTRIVVVVFLFGLFNTTLFAQVCEEKTVDDLGFGHGTSAFGEHSTLDPFGFSYSWSAPPDTWVHMPSRKGKVLYYRDKAGYYSIWIKVYEKNLVVSVSYFFPHKGYEIVNKVLYFEGEFEDSNWNYEQRYVCQMTPYTFCELQEQILKALEMSEVKDLLPAGFLLDEPPAWITMIPRQFD